MHAEPDGSLVAKAPDKADVAGWNTVEQLTHSPSGKHRFGSPSSTFGTGNQQDFPTHESASLHGGMAAFGVHAGGSDIGSGASDFEPSLRFQSMDLAITFDGAMDGYEAQQLADSPDGGGVDEVTLKTVHLYSCLRHATAHCRLPCWDRRGESKTVWLRSLCE